MLTTVAFLVIVMGMALSLAREVRRRSADAITRELLTQLDRVLATYLSANKGILPPAESLITPSLPEGTVLDPISLNQRSLQNNRDFVGRLRYTRGFEDTEAVFGKVSRGMYDDSTLRDAWGKPIVLMASMHPQIGMASDNRPFFFSAGPDRDYLTRDDNLYSYETAPGGREATPGSTTAPAAK